MFIKKKINKKLALQAETGKSSYFLLVLSQVKSNQVELD